MAKEKVRPLSWSQMSTLLGCGEKFRLTYVDKAPRGPQGALIAGSVVHETIEWAEHEEIPARFIEGGAFEESNLREALGLRFVATLEAAIEANGGPEAIRWAGRKSKRFPFGENDVWWKASGPMMLRRWLEIRVTDLHRGVKLLEASVERHVVAALDGGREIQGFVDAVLAVDENGAPFVRDWKTGQPNGSSPLQLAVYAWLLGKSTGVTVRAGEFGYLRAVEPSKRIVRYEDLSELVEIVPAVFEQHLQRAEAGVFSMNPSSFCSSCNVAEFCAYGKWLARHANLTPSEN